MTASPLDQLNVVAEHRGLHLILPLPDERTGRWQLGLVRPPRELRDGARPFRSYEGMWELTNETISDAAARLLASVTKAPPSRGS